MRIDWEYIKQIYFTDQVVDIKMVGFNKCGLLANRSKFSGFIPYSHIIFDNKKPMTAMYHYLLWPGSYL